MGKLFYRVYVLLCMLVLRLRAVAQTGDDEDDMTPLPGKGGGGKDTGEFDMLEDMEFTPVRITFDDVLTVVVLLVVCYVFGKIWKGCSYLILILAGIFYYMTRY